MRTRSDQTDRVHTAREPSIRERVLHTLWEKWRDKHGSTMKDKTVFRERTLGQTENSKTSNVSVAQGTSRVKEQSLTATRMDMECQTLLPTEGNFPIQTAGATPDKDKNDGGTRTAASTVSTAATNDTDRELTELWWIVDFSRFCCVRVEWI